MTALTDILLPADQTEGTTNVVGKWFKAVGDSVATNDPLLEITTDKVTVEIAAPHDGVLVEILKAEGDNVEQGEIIGRLGPAGASASPESAKPPAATPATAGSEHTSRSIGGSETELSPAVRRLLKQYGLDPAAIKGSGRGGRVTVEDVEAAATAATIPAKPAESVAGRMVPHTQMRKSIAAHMVSSVATAPHVTTVFEADLSAIMAHRESHKGAVQAGGGKLTLTAYFVQATAKALQAVPEVNSRWHDQALELFDDCNVGVGTALETGGLIVPVIHQAQTLDLFGTASRLHQLTERARSGSLTPKEVQGGTFTISNHGVSGSLVATPIIINQPQSAILGIGKLAKRAVVTGDDRIVAKPMVYVSLTIDHRVLDGFQANTFLTHWVRTIEHWT